VKISVIGEGVSVERSVTARGVVVTVIVSRSVMVKVGSRLKVTVGLAELEISVSVKAGSVTTAISHAGKIAN